MNNKKNIKGEYGVINFDGKVGSTSYMVDVKNPCFWENIEDGIIPVVSILLKYNIKTFGSCQGHFTSENGLFQANVRYYIDSSDHNQLC